MNEELLEARPLIKTDITCWSDAAQHCEKLAAGLTGKEQAEYMLLCAVYRERAKILSDALQRLDDSIRQPSNDKSAFQDSGQSIFS